MSRWAEASVASELYESARTVLEDVAIPDHRDLSVASEFARQWQLMVELGWTTILDCTSASSEERSDVISAACAVVEALGRSGSCMPLRHGLAARWESTTSIDPPAIVVAASADGTWYPIADVIVSAAGDVSPHSPSAQRQTDVAGRPVDPVKRAEGMATGHVDVLLMLHEMAGAAEGALKEARRYVNEREQFGKRLIQIPAVAATLGELSLSVIELNELVDAARSAVLGDLPGHRFLCRTALDAAQRVAPLIADSAHQLHGAMGITREARLHLFTKNLWAMSTEDFASDDVGEPANEHELWDLTTPADLPTPVS